MQSENRWIYIVGIGVLAALVIVGLVWRSGEPETGDGGDGGRDAGSSSSAEAGATASSGDGAPTTGEGGAAVGTLPSLSSDGQVDDIGSVPEDPAECRAYCARLAERGALSSGTGAEGCVQQLCAAEEPADAGRVPTMAEPEFPEMPEDCQAQCQLLQRRGELAEGTTLEQCYTALCGSEAEEESEE